MLIDPQVQVQQLSVPYSVKVLSLCPCSANIPQMGNGWKRRSSH